MKVRLLAGYSGFMLQNKRGFTLLELTLATATLALLAVIAIPVTLSVYTKNDLRNSVQITTQAMRQAQSYAFSGREDDDWGVRVASGSVTLFKGDDYSTRDTDYDEVATISTGITIGGTLSEIIFSEASGLPESTGTVTYTSQNSELITITLNALGSVSY
jgi:prepilin-type N-terminal cleavage/methylation domain-containing protein